MCVKCRLKGGQWVYQESIGEETFVHVRKHKHDRNFTSKKTNTFDYGLVCRSSFYGDTKKSCSGST